MRSAPRLRTLLLAAVAAAACLVPTEAVGETLSGRLTDAMTGVPIPNARVRVLGTNRTTETGPNGRWSFDLPRGHYQLAVTKRLAARRYRFRLVRQHVPQYKPADSTLITSYYANRGYDRVPMPRGGPVARPHHPSDRDHGTVTLDGATPTFDPSGAMLPEMPDDTIRVARRREKDDCSTEVVAIEEMPIEEYVRGVLPPEIGVFRNLANVEEVYRAFALAAKSYGLYFTLVYDENNRRRVGESKPPNGFEWFHIDDTPCNQRYSDKRLTVTDRAAESQAGRILVKKGAPDTLDKFEYAASCGEHGSRPAYQRAIVDDASPTTSCVEGWCGHEECAGHADHPNVSGSDDCLVRGFCQWGAAEWAEDGRDHEWLIDHYQPNLQIERVWQTGSTTDLKGYVYTDPSDIPGSAVAGATVEFGGQTVQTNKKGRYTIEAVDDTRRREQVRASHPDYGSGDRSVLILPDRTNWASILLEKPGSDVGDGRLDPDGGDTIDAGSSRPGGLGDGCGAAPSRTPLPFGVVLLFVGAIACRARGSQ